MIENKSAPRTDEEVTRLILSSAALYPKLVDHLDYVDFGSMSPETYRESPFLNHRIIVSDDFWARIPLDVLTELLKKNHSLKLSMIQPHPMNARDSYSTSVT